MGDLFTDLAAIRRGERLEREEEEDLPNARRKPFKPVNGEKDEQDKDREKSR